MLWKPRVIALLALSACCHAEAQDYTTPEAWAAVKAGEEAHLDTGTVSAVGPLTRFEVTIGWGGSTASRPQDYIARRVRYAADCKAGTLMVVAVGLFDPSGRAFKTLISPPGAAEASAPSAGTQEQRWLNEVCRAREQ
ncbi:MAG TPA: hypothetical protein VMH32_03980 [Burkholderiales bacterium]|nr:hypothetical protein [Burkholderiales bacterium]